MIRSSGPQKNLTSLVVGEISGGHFEKARCEGESAPGFFSVFLLTAQH